MTAFPTIRRKTSPTPIGLRPGFLSNGINLHERKASMVSFCSVQSFLATLAIDWQRLSELSPKELLSNIRLHPSESRFEGPEPPFVRSAAFLSSQRLFDRKIRGELVVGDRLLTKRMGRVPSTLDASVSGSREFHQSMEGFHSSYCLLKVS